MDLSKAIISLSCTISPQTIKKESPQRRLSFWRLASEKQTIRLRSWWWKMAGQKQKQQKLTPETLQNTKASRSAQCNPISRARANRPGRPQWPFSTNSNPPWPLPLVKPISACTKTWWSLDIRPKRAEGTTLVNSTVQIHQKILNKPIWYT